MTDAECRMTNMSKGRSYPTDGLDLRNPEREAGNKGLSPLTTLKELNEKWERV